VNAMGDSQESKAVASLVPLILTAAIVQKLAKSNKKKKLNKLA